ncbi:MAG: hypothetical protein NTW19_00305 [Planctomycetota bacterium]|nr:hypothetical protein [Planctomycetota bacterium]
MDWIIQLDGISADRGVAWAREFLGHYDLSRLEWLKIARGRSKHGGVYGRCHYPTDERPACRISCQVAGPFPCRILTRRPPVYRGADGVWPPLPAGCLHGLRCHDRRTGRWWTRVIGQTMVEDADEAVVWIVAHEAFHYLRRTKQVPGRNTEIFADRFADERLAEFRALRRPEPMLFFGAVAAAVRRVRALARV